MTPLGHLAVAYSLSKGVDAPKRTSLAPYVVLGALAPDVDFLLIGLESFNALHRTLTHNLFFVLLVALLCAFFVRFSGWEASFAAFIGAVLGGLSHLFTDAVLDSNPSNGVGVAALWPLSERFFSPFNLAPQRCPGWEDPLAATLCNLPLVLYEVPFYLLAALLLRRTITANPKTSPKVKTLRDKVNR